MLRTLLMASVAVALSAMSAQADGQPGAEAAVSLKTPVGVVRGTADANGVQSFKGIPYAVPPVGALRWTPARAAPAWTGERDASTFGPACLQRLRMTAAEQASSGAAPEKTSENCLTLNVWVPAHTSRPAPVMVWIHGGDHVTGASSLPFYDGTSFARDGVVFVSINYRLGLMGYFAHPALTKAAAGDATLGNYGASDQIEALRWVQKNIAAFGGDPANVTVFGESAGAQSTLTLLTVPAAKGLFARAIAQSPYITARFQTLSEAEATGAGVATAAGLPGAEATVEQLRAADGQALIALQDKLPHGPIVDGRLVPRNPVKSFARGDFIHVPLMLGTNSDEGAVAAPGEADATFARAPDEVKALARSYYASATEKQAARKLWRDGTFTEPTHWVARKASASQPVFLYHYDYVPERLRNVWTGVPHGYEIPFVFDTLGSVPPIFAKALSDADRASAAVTHSCWVSFATTGTPACTGAPAWPRFTPATAKLMDFGITDTIKDHLDKPILDAVDANLVKAGKLTR